MNARTAIFDKIREVRGKGFTQSEVDLIDGLCAELGIAKEPEAGRRHISKEGLELIKSFEGLRLAAYKDAVGVWTIGWGSTGPHVRQGLTITRDEAEALLLQDLRRFEECVHRHCPDASDNQFAAMVSLAFNIGCGAFERSTLLKLHKAGKHRLAKLQFGRWVFAGGKKLKGLIGRRIAEAELYGKAS